MPKCSFRKSTLDSVRSSIGKNCHRYFVKIDGRVIKYSFEDGQTEVTVLNFWETCQGHQCLSELVPISKDDPSEYLELK